MTDLLNIPGYRVERLLGQGGMAEVFLAKQLSLARKVAIKVMDPHHSDKEFSQRFLHEARMVATMNHANIITIYDFGKLESGKFYLCMEYLGGGDLEQRLRTGISEQTALQVVHDLANGLRFVHSKGIVHRDIKPANILFREDNTLVLTDFGIAKEVNNDASLTQAGVMVGSASYASPEQIQGLVVDLRTDIYSIGVLLVEMLTGNNPFKADTFINTAMNHLQMDIPVLYGNSRKFQPMIEKMLAKKPADRFANMEQVLEAIDAYQHGTNARTSPASITQTTSSVPISHATAEDTKKQTITSKITVPPAPEPTRAADSLSNSLDDDFMDEAMQLLAQSDSILESSSLHKKNLDEKPGQPHQPAPDMRRAKSANDFLNAADIARARQLGNMGSRPTPPGRSRPLPSNLFDDEDA